jgi:hypothetical protein
MPADEINRPAVVAEVRAAFEAYERALLANDLAALDAWFWDHEATTRYGIAEHSQGAAAIRTWRSQAQPVDPRRRLQHTVIVTFGRDAASVATEFVVPDSTRIGRQTQMWVRFGDAWRIVSAHVSEIESGPLERF